jgi:hypothetical protein
MKIKNKSSKVIFSSAILLGGLFFGGLAQAAVSVDVNNQCANSGGTFVPNALTVPCQNCPSDKVTGCSGGYVCQTKADYDLCVSSNDNPIVSATIGGAGNTQNAVVQPTKLKYTLLESFPGFFQANTEMTDFPKMILSIYKFGIWTVGIAGMFMLVVGGFMYMASAGNTSTAGNARGIINDALLGIVAAMGAYLILYVINPDLTKINLNFTPVEVTETLGIGEGGGSCAALQEGPCSVANLRNTCFRENAEAASKVCNYESGGMSNSPSKTDRGADGNIFSWGLFQINLTQHSLGGYDCQAAFDGKNYASKVIDQAMYANCRFAANTVLTNINYACKISSNGSNWKPWANTKKACGL